MNGNRLFDILAVIVISIIVHLEELANDLPKLILAIFTVAMIGLGLGIIFGLLVAIFS